MSHHRIFSIISSNIKWIWKSVSKQWTDLNMLIYWWSSPKTLFWLRTCSHWTSNLIGSSLDLLIYFSDRLEHRFFWTSKRLEHVNLMIIELKFHIFDQNDRTSNIVWPINMPILSKKRLRKATWTERIRVCLCNLVVV